MTFDNINSPGKFPREDEVRARAVILEPRDEYNAGLAAIANAMSDHEINPVGIKIREAFAALDDLNVMANQSATRDQVRSERVLIGQLLNRCQLLASFALIDQPEARVLRFKR